MASALHHRPNQSMSTSTKKCSGSRYHGEKLTDEHDAGESDFTAAEYKRACKGNEARCRMCVRILNQYRLYRIKPDEYDAVWQNQKGKCAICSESLARDKGTHTDHDHVTGKVRGILCDCCNPGIGFLRENGSNLKAAILYLGLEAEIQEEFSHLFIANPQSASEKDVPKRGKVSD